MRATNRTTEGDWVTVARLTRTRGNRGELAAISLSSGPERFASLSDVVLASGEGFAGEMRSYVIEEVWQHGSRLIFKFQGVDSIPEAEALRGAEVRVRLEERAALPEGEYYQSDLIGCEVVDRKTREALGQVTGWQDAGAAGILEVESTEPDGEILIPFARSICVEIDVAAKRIVVDLPEGLKELNRR